MNCELLSSGSGNLSNVGTMKMFPDFNLFILLDGQKYVDNKKSDLWQTIIALFPYECLNEAIKS